ncbi:hypothetical protein P872_11540 [Rhodonellum psychrophilum GCM71 = DSM 17998]|uniref:Uncharacterized protein n=1 Tax=Rhodonellum psychrophilum GCM71 = DSM 17998 TaxID=1123057 RepID=U5BT06_9BACT|nr:hypothetical protein P872_11540 [Rhodonellum psychrophilum GCM71 = DSM 17998]
MFTHLFFAFIYLIKMLKKIIIVTIRRILLDLWPLTNYFKHLEFFFKN